MATIPSPSTQTASAVVTSTLLNNHRDALQFLLGSTMTGGGGRKGLAVLNQTVAQTFATSGTAAAITFTSETVDYDNAHSTVTNTSRYTALTPGYYDVSGVIAWANNSVGFRWAYLAVNGTPVLGSANVVAATGAITVSTPEMPIFLNGTTDYVELWGKQTSTASLNTAVAGASGEQSMLSVEWRSN